MSLRFLLLLALVVACADEPPGGSLDGVRIGSKRRLAVTEGLCRLYAHCGGGGARWDDDGNLCQMELLADYPTRVEEELSADCEDAMLDYQACVAMLRCSELDSPGVWDRHNPNCAELAERRDTLCQ